jgi:hypothetical protein
MAPDREMISCNWKLQSPFAGTMDCDGRRGRHWRRAWNRMIASVGTGADFESTREPIESPYSQLGDRLDLAVRRSWSSHVKDQYPLHWQIAGARQLMVCCGR